MAHYKFAIHISTKNRGEELLYTLQKIKYLLNENVECLVFDDGSVDNTFEKVKINFPEVILHRNEISKGYIYCRNKMLNETSADFVISLDDDAHFLSDNPLSIIENYFSENLKCGLIATRIFWSKEEIEMKQCTEIAQKVQSFIGCGHIWRMKAWKEIPNYPEWFQFYGEENFASIQLFKLKWGVHYVPELFVQHRVNLSERSKLENDFAFRYRRSIRAGWFNYFLFLPLNKIPKKMAYSIWMQFKSKIFKGDLKVISPLFLAILDLIIFIPNLIKHRNSLNTKEYYEYNKLNEAKIYWKPEK